MALAAVTAHAAGDAVPLPVSKAPVVKLTVDPGTVVVGKSATLHWRSRGATACMATGAWSGAVGLNGSQVQTPTMAGSSSFTLTCSGAGGTAASTVTLIATTTVPPPTVAVALAPTAITVGQSSVLTWSSTNATACSASGAWSGAQATSGSVTETPAVFGSDTYTLTCTGPDGTASNSATLTVNPVAPAPTVAISVNPARVEAGTTAALTWSSTNATDCTASGSWTGTEATSGTANETTPAAGTNTYTLTCNGPGGSGSNSAVLTVYPAQSLISSLDPGVVPSAVTINQGTAIGQGALNGATPVSLANVAADPNNTQTVTSSTNPFTTVGNVPDTAAGFCSYAGATPLRVSYVTGSKFNTTAAAGATGGDPSVTMAPYYFPLVYNSTVTTTDNAFGGKPPIIGLFDWRPKDIDEALVAAESDDNGKTWYFMQTVLELNPDYTNPISGGYGFAGTAGNTGCPSTITGTNANTTALNGSNADNGWGHAAIVQLPGAGNSKTGQFLYLLDRGPGIDVNPLWVINLASPNGTNGGASPKFPIWNSNNTAAGANDVKSIYSALNNSAGAAAAGNTVTVKQTAGLLNPDGIMAVFPTSATAAAGSPVTVLYVQKILNGDDTGTTALPTSQQCLKAPFSGKVNHDISNVRLATTTDGINFTDLGIVNGLNDPTTVDYNKTRWVSPRGTLIDVNGDGSLWGLYFSAGNCLDGDSDAFHYIGYAESSDMINWNVYNDINSPIASINTITTTNQADGSTVTIPAQAPVVATQPWFAQRLYAPTATQIDPTHLSLTFAGYGVQTPGTNLLNYRQIGNVVLTVNKALPAGVPNNINAH